LPTIGWHVPLPAHPGCAPHHPALVPAVGQRTGAYAFVTAGY
jgi:hypothetical protein